MVCRKMSLRALFYLGEIVMFQSSYSPDYVVPDLVKFFCTNCKREFILSEKYDNKKASCPYCQSKRIEGIVLLDNPDLLGELGCMAISK